MIPALIAESLSLPGLPEFEIDAKWYYAACAFVFLLFGMVLGYFIWRKGHMQMLDAEAEVRRTKAELARLKEDLNAEQGELNGQASPGA